MKEQELWQAYTNEKPACKNEQYEAWCYGSDNPDLSTEILNRSLQIADIFQVAKLQPSAVVSVFYSAV